MSTSDEPPALWLGVLACIVAAVGFGTLHVPIRRFPTGDGFFVQWAMSVGILITGFVINVIEGFPSFQPIAVIGGVLWTVANTLSQRVITGLGLAVALLLWNTTNCLTGWASGRFGLFGVKARPPQSDLLNELGLAFVLIGGFVIAFVRKTPAHPVSSRLDRISPEADAHLAAELGAAGDATPRFRRKSRSLPHILVPDYGVLRSSKKRQMVNADRLCCIVLALIAGLFYGATLIPVFYLEDNRDKFPHAPSTGLPYVFSHYFGVFMGSSAIFVAYALIRRNRPMVNPEIVLPSIVGGAIWAIAMAMMLVANDALGQTITYPITTTVPGCVAALWSVFYFKEITSKRNFTLLIFAFALICVGTGLVVLSKLEL